MDSLRQTLTPIFSQAFAVDSIWSVVLRFVLWAVIGVVIIASVDAVRPSDQARNLKSNLGLFLLILVLGGLAIYLLFGFIPGVSQ